MLVASCWLLVKPVGNQTSFAKSSWGRDEGEFAALLHSLVEFFDEVGAGDERRP